MRLLLTAKSDEGAADHWSGDRHGKDDRTFTVIVSAHQNGEAWIEKDLQAVSVKERLEPILDHPQSDVGFFARFSLYFAGDCSMVEPNA
jgi:hypothetical protein